MDRIAIRKGRPRIPISTQVHVFFRDGWICHWCHRPTVFPPALKYLQKFVENAQYEHSIAYYDLRYRRDKAPLLDHLAAVIDHVEPYSKGGVHDERNLVTACNKCNTRKAARRAEDYVEKNPERLVKSRSEEPKYWDGFASLFVIYGRQNQAQFTSQEKEWFKEIEAHVASER
jgi:5-methylcytosine-specific restriction endonuclease McrA